MIIGWLVGRLVNLVGWLVGRSVGGLVGWLVVCPCSFGLCVTRSKQGRPSMKGKHKKD